jgi:hypothetical protein
LLYRPKIFVDTYKRKETLTPGGIAGITVAIFVVVVLAVIAIIIYLERRRRV